MMRLTDSERLRRTEINTGSKVKMILDTDTYNEIDDQFAIFYALASKERIQLLGITAELFHNARSSSYEDGMEKSYQEICKILGFLDISPEGFAFRGCREPLKNAACHQESEAVDFMIEQAMKATEEEPLYIVGIGAGTNIASAILKEPDIISRIVVVWLGGNTYSWKDNVEFNLSQDPAAGSVLFDSGVPMIQVPASGVTGFLLTTVPELEACMGGANDIADYLIENVKSYKENHFAWSKPIWDIGAVALLVNPEWTPYLICHAPVITENQNYAFDGRRHLIRYVYEMDRDAIFADMFRKIKELKQDAGRL